MSDSYRQLKNELLDQSTYTLKEVEHRLDMVMFYAAEVACEECDEDSGSNAYFYNMACYNIAGALRKEVLGE